jgi:hypothetical protein
LLDALHLDVEDDYLALSRLLLDGRLAGSVQVASELGAVDKQWSAYAHVWRATDLLLNEAILVDQLPESILGDKVVFYAVALTVTGAACGMRHRQSEGIGVSAEEHVDQRALSDTAGA